MGSLKSIIGMLPGVGSKLKDADIDDRQFVRIEAMITSMTKAERAKPSIINPPASGVSPPEAAPRWKM